MCNCTKNSAARAQSIAAAPANAAPRVRAAQSAGAPSALHFEYVGRTAMKVIGPLSGRQYHFAHPGARVSIDARDGAALEQVPNLRRVGAT